MHSESTATERRPRLYALAVFLIAVVGHLWALDFPFYVDDFPQLFESRELFHRGVLLGETEDARGVRGVSNYFRPTLRLSFWLDATLGGFRLAVFHWTSILLHALTSVLVLGLGHRLRAPRLGLAWALIFAAHPAPSEAVYWIAARGDLLVTFFAVAGAHAVLAARSEGHRLAAPLAVLCCVGAATSKESGMVVPAILAAGSVLLPGRRRGAWKLDGAMLLATAIVWVVRREIFGIEGVHYVGLELELGSVSIERAVRRYPEAILTFFGRDNAYGGPLLILAAIAGLAACGWRGLRLRAALLIVVGLGLALPPALVLLEASWVGISRHMSLPSLFLGLVLATPFAERAEGNGRVALRCVYGMLLLALCGPIFADRLNEVAETGRIDRVLKERLAETYPHVGGVDVGIFGLPEWIGFGLPLSLKPPFTDENLDAQALTFDAPATWHRLTRSDRNVRLLAWNGQALALERLSGLMAPPRKNLVLDRQAERPGPVLALEGRARPRDVPVLDVRLRRAESVTDPMVTLTFADSDGHTFRYRTEFAEGLRLALEDEPKWFALGDLTELRVAVGTEVLGVRSLRELPRLRIVAPERGRAHSFENDGDLVVTFEDATSHHGYRLVFREPVTWSRTVLRDDCTIEGKRVSVSTVAPAVESFDEPGAGAMSGAEIMRVLELKSLDMVVVVEALAEDLKRVVARSRPRVVTVVP